MDSFMKHAVVVQTAPKAAGRKVVEAELTGERRIFLEQREYAPEELERFRAGQAGWLLRRAGSRQFTADSDSGEDAWGHYCKYFDWKPENAVFEDGRLVGFWLCGDWLRYSGNGRDSFSIDDWGYPGVDPFTRGSLYGRHVYAFLFEEAESHAHQDWKLLKREPGAEYKSRLEF